jgi:hypothetical protein
MRVDEPGLPPQPPGKLTELAHGAQTAGPQRTLVERRGREAQAVRLAHSRPRAANPDGRNETRRVKMLGYGKGIEIASPKLSCIEDLMIVCQPKLHVGGQKRTGPIA